MLMATSRRRNLGVGVAGVLDLNLLSLGALDLSGIVGSVSGERGQTDVPTVLLQRKRRNDVRRKMNKEQRSTRFKLRSTYCRGLFLGGEGKDPLVLAHRDHRRVRRHDVHVGGGQTQPSQGLAAPLQFGDLLGVLVSRQGLQVEGANPFFVEKGRSSTPILVVGFWI